MDFDHMGTVKLSVNTRKGTRRGLHYQCAPHEEVKLVWCTAGTIVVPMGFSHSNKIARVSYCMSEVHVPASPRGFRWDDPAFKIAWPAPILVMSE